jgi:mRNA-degrading endonuclease RelE of RelBE toxin-antitoxin system
VTVWRFRLSSGAIKVLRRADRDTRERIAAKIDGLTADPFTASKPLGGTDMRSARVGGLRIRLDRR